MSTQERNQRRAKLEQLSDLDLTLMAGDYLASLEDHVAVKDWRAPNRSGPTSSLSTKS